jgi:hypothetical protein
LPAILVAQRCPARVCVQYIAIVLSLAGQSIAFCCTSRPTRILRNLKKRKKEGNTRGSSNANSRYQLLNQQKRQHPSHRIVGASSG